MSIPSRPELARRRRDLARVVLRDLAETGEVTVPARWEEEVRREFGGLDGLLAELSRQWWTACAAHLDALVELGPGDPCRVWDDVAAQSPWLRVVLDAHAASPALAEAEWRHREALSRTPRRAFRRPRRPFTCRMENIHR